jgi:hypothetical protein
VKPFVLSIFQYVGKRATRFSDTIWPFSKDVIGMVDAGDAATPFVAMRGDFFSDY